MKKNSKRIGVFVFYDKEGIVDDYVLFLLKNINEVLDKLIIVSNCYLKVKEKNKLLKYTNIIEVRENVGLDAGAFKYIYCKYKAEIDNYDELVLFNDTFYGPFKPFKSIFDDMSKKYVDFWGLSGHYDAVDGYGFMPDHMIHAHIQTFFIVFRKSVLNSDAFVNYWLNYDVNNMRSFIDVVTKHELSFTYYLEQNGFIWDTYVDLSSYKSKEITGNYSVYSYNAYDLIKNHSCPFIKRKNFVFNKRDALYLDDGMDTRKAIEYIKDKNLYDVDLIYNNICRIYSAEDIYYGMNLSYVVEEEKIKNNNFAILFYLNNFSIANYVKDKIDCLKSKNIYIFTTNKEVKKLFEGNYYVNIKEDFSKKYEYLFIANDYNGVSTKIIAPYIDMIYSLLENGIKSDEYIGGVLNIFEKNNHLDLLLLPECLHSEYFYDILNQDKKVHYLKNACWVRSYLYKGFDKNDYNYIDLFLDNINKSKKLFAKIMDSNYAGNRTLVQELIINETYKKMNGYMNLTSKSYPEVWHFLNPPQPRVISKLANNKVARKVYILMKKIYHKIKKR